MSKSKEAKELAKLEKGLEGAKEQIEYNEQHLEEQQKTLEENQEYLKKLEEDKKRYEELSAKYDELMQGGVDASKLDEAKQVIAERDGIGYDAYTYDIEIQRVNGNIPSIETNIRETEQEIANLKQQWGLDDEDKENDGAETDSQAAAKPAEEESQPKVSGIDYATDSRFTAPKQDTPEVDSGAAKRPAGKTLSDVNNDTKWKNMTEHYRSQVQPVPEVTSSAAAKPGKSLASTTLEQAAANSQKMTGNLLAENDPQYEGIDDVVEMPEVDSEAAAKAEEERINGLVKAVMHGDYGNGDDRKEALGADYDAVQAGVNAEYEKAKQRAAMVEAPEETGAVQAVMEMGG